MSEINKNSKNNIETSEVNKRGHFNIQSSGSKPIDIAYLTGNKKPHTGQLNNKNK